MRVRIINGVSWYEKFVGIVYEVNNCNGNLFFLKYPPAPQCNFIFKSDAEIVMDRGCSSCACPKPCDRCKSGDFDHWVPTMPWVKHEMPWVKHGKRIKNTEQDRKLPNLYKVLTDKYNLAVDKNADYGNSFDKIMDKLVDHDIDPLQGLYIRLADKFNRFETLLFSDTQMVKDESIRDTLKDLSNYVDLYFAWEASRNGK